MNKGIKWGLIIGGGIVVVGITGIVIYKYVYAPKLSPDQEKFVSQLHPKVQNDFRKFIKEIETTTGWTVVPTSAYRTFAQQVVEHNANSLNAQPGYSEHNYGIALDFTLKKGNQELHKNSPKQDWINTGIPNLAKTKYGMRWGGDFNGYQDNVHFDYANKYPAAKLRQLAIQQFGNDENRIIGNQVRISSMAA